MHTRAKEGDSGKDQNQRAVQLGKHIVSKKEQVKSNTKKQAMIINQDMNWQKHSETHEDKNIGKGLQQRLGMATNWQILRVIHRLKHKRESVQYTGETIKQSKKEV